jgi:hypothetical protein
LLISFLRPLTPTSIQTHVTSGNRGQATRYVVARDTTPPVVTLVGPELYVVEGGEPYTPPLYGNPGVQAHDLVDDDWYFTMMNRITITLEHVALGSSGFSGDPANYSDITSGNQAQHTYLAGKSVSRCTLGNVQACCSNCCHGTFMRFFHLLGVDEPIRNLSFLFTHCMKCLHVPGLQCYEAMFLKFNNGFPRVFPLVTFFSRFFLPGTRFLPHPSFSKFNISYTAVDNANRVSDRVFRIIQVQDSRAPSLDVTSVPRTFEAAAYVPPPTHTYTSAAPLSTPSHPRLPLTM